MGRPCPLKLLLPMGDLDLHLIHDSLGQSEPIAQTASRSVQPFLQGSLFIFSLKLLIGREPAAGSLLHAESLHELEFLVCLPVVNLPI